MVPNSDKTNNKLENLEWSTGSYNGEHAWENSLHKNSERMIKVNKVNKNGEIINTYRSILEACRENDIKTFKHKLTENEFLVQLN